MAIKKGKKTLEREKLFREFQERLAETYIEVKCPIHTHYTFYVRDDLQSSCPLCKKDGK